MSTQTDNQGTRSDDQFVEIPDLVADDIRLALAVHLSNACESLTGTLGGLEHVASARETYAESINEIRRTLALVDQLGAFGEPAAPMIADDLHALAVQARDDLALEIGQMVREAPDPVELFRRGETMNERGVALVALAEASCTADCGALETGAAA